MKIQRKSLLRWLGWFGLINGFIAALIGLRYLFFYSFPDDAWALSYVPLATITHFIILVNLPTALLLIPLTLIVPSKRLIFSLAILFVTLIITSLIVDANFFAENRYHLSFLTSVLFDSTTYALIALQFLIVLVFESMLANHLFKLLNAAGRKSMYGKKIACLIIISWVYVQGLHIWADATYYNAITGFTRYLPAYRPLHAKRDLARLGWIDSEALRNERAIEKLGEAFSEELSYPIKPITCPKKSSNQLNVLLIVVDALRPEMVDAKITPTIERFKEKAIRFNNHYSGGTSSRMGAFSIFYGIPTTYWRTFHDNQRSSILIDKFLDHQYQVLGISSAGFGSPTVLDRTAFARVKDLNVKRLSSLDKESNRLVTKKWLEWLSEYKSERPFFSYLHYDPPMNAIDSIDFNLIPKQFLTEETDQHLKEVGRYTQSILFVDSEIDTILESLNRRGLLKETVIIITSDHGYELNDYDTGYYGHASNYSRAQLKTPFFMLWPNRDAKEFTRQTSHNDIVPTLLTEVLGCSNPASDYSSGFNLFSGESWEFLVTGSYDSYAIVSDDQVVVSYGGYYEVMNQDDQSTSSRDLDRSLLESAMKEMKRFYK
jgi:membrane-anchored protein YejM (alkaline phosphatase superfamily)